MYAKVAVNTAYSSDVIQYGDYNFSLSLSLDILYRSSSRIIAARMSSNGKGTVSNEEEAYVDMQ